MTPSEDQKNVDFLRLYVKHEESLHGFVRALVPTREDARDVMQEVAVVLWRKIGALSDMEDFRRWAFGVARKQALTFLRNRARDRHVFGDEVLALLAEDVEANADAFEAERNALEECLGKLDAAQRALVNEAYAPGVRIDVLAVSAGRSPMSLYKALHRIRLALMDCTQRVLSRREFA